MIPSTFQDFLQFVLDKTRNQKLKWIQGEGSSYVVSNGNMSLYISTDYDVDRDISSFWFRLISENGQTTPFSVFEYEQNDYRFMRVLYEEIIANANGAKNDLARFMQGL